MWAMSWVAARQVDLFPPARILKVYTEALKLGLVMYSSQMVSMTSCSLKVVSMKTAPAMGLIGIMYEVCPEVIQPCNMKNIDIYWRRYKVQETLYLGQWHLSPLPSRYLGTSHSSPSCHQLPCHIFLNLIDGLKSLPFQRWFWKSQKSQGTKAGSSGGLSHLGNLMFCQKLCMRPDAWVGVLLWWSCQSPFAHSCSLLNLQIVSAEEYSSLMQNLMRVRYSTHPVILNVTATQYICSLIGVYGPRPLLTSTVKSPLFTHACSCPFSLVPGYIDAAQSILVLLTMAGRFWTDLVCLWNDPCSQPS